MTTPEIQAAVLASRRRCEQWIVEHFPGASFLRMGREPGRDAPGGWYNGLPQIYDLDQQRLDDEDFDDNLEDFYEACKEDYDVWINNSLDEAYDAVFVIGSEGTIEDFLPAAPVPPPCGPDEVRVNFGMGSKIFPAHLRVDDYVEGVRQWRRLSKDDQLVLFLGDIRLTENEPIAGGQAVEVVKRMRERSAPG